LCLNADITETFIVTEPRLIQFEFIFLTFSGSLMIGSCCGNEQLLVYVG
jgi:hypothetical protein